MKKSLNVITDRGDKIRWQFINTGQIYDHLKQFINQKYNSKYQLYYKGARLKEQQQIVQDDNNFIYAAQINQQAKIDLQPIKYEYDEVIKYLKSLGFSEQFLMQNLEQNKTKKINYLQKIYKHSHMFYYMAHQTEHFTKHEKQNIQRHFIEQFLRTDQTQQIQTELLKLTTKQIGIVNHNTGAILIQYLNKK